MDKRNYTCDGNLDSLCETLAEAALEKGFTPSRWNDNLPVKFMLMTTEICEAMQEFRHFKALPTTSFDPGYSFLSKEDKQIADNIKEELADLAIRLFAMSHELGFSLEKEVAAKAIKNEDRPPKHNRRC